MVELILDDCMNVMRDYDDNHFDLAIIDPPYGIGGGANTKKMNIDWDSKIPDKKYFDELIRVSKNQIIWGCNYMSKNIPFSSKHTLVWDKGEGFYNRTFAECELAWTSFDKNTKKIKHDPLAKRDYVGKIHPTQKPVQLYKWILHNYAEKGQKILDTHLGSGSIAIACHYFGCDLIGIEIDEEYYNKAKHRINELTKQETLW